MTAMSLSSPAGTVSQEAIACSVAVGLWALEVGVAFLIAQTTQFSVHTFLPFVPQLPTLPALDSLTVFDLMFQRAAHIAALYLPLVGNPAIVRTHTGRIWDLHQVSINGFPELNLITADPIPDAQMIYWLMYRLQDLTKAEQILFYISICNMPSPEIYNHKTHILWRRGVHLLAFP